MPLDVLSSHLEHLGSLAASQPWLLIGIAVVTGFLVGKLASVFKLPEVVGYIIGGVLLGPSLINFFNLELLDRMGLVSDLALGLVAFTIGTELTRGLVSRLGPGLFVVILAESFGAFLLVASVVFLLTRDLATALIFGALAPASAPAGTVVVLQEYKAKGPLTSLLLAVVGLDDGLAIMMYAFAASIAKMLLAHASSVSLVHLMKEPVFEIIGAIVLGGCIGAVLAFAVRKARSSGEMLTMALGGVFVCAGLADMFGVSLILSNLVIGAVVANISPGFVRKVFGAVQNITAPIYVVFFVLAGAHLQLRLLPSMGVLGLLYIVGRSAGLVGGAYLGATLSRMEATIRKYLGLGILSQAGVAVGLALMVGRDLGGLGPDGARIALLAINTIAATTIVFEIIGPITTKIAITAAGEVGKQTSSSASQEVL
jgi:Kef-type K+ transport system membrane component KefB